MDSASFSDNTQSSETGFTITHNAPPTLEHVRIFLQNERNPVLPGEKNRYIVAKGECLNITQDQFKRLVVQVGRGKFGAPTFKTLCGENKTECQPDNYEIINQGDWVNDYRMIEDNDTHYNCVDINQWMAIKNSKLI